VTQVPSLSLNNGNTIPQLGFGVWQVEPDEVEKAIGAAFDAGYRHIDTAAMYGNEEGVGRAIAASGIDRSELFITTKLNNDSHGREESVAALEESLGKLGLDYVDLYLIHWPLPGVDRYVETWKGFEELYRDGKARSIGVSNFHENHLNRLAAETDVTPAVNQVEVHPFFTQTALRQVNADRGILTEAWTPLGRGDLESPTIGSIAEEVGKSPAQVVIRWHVQEGNVVFPKSVTPSRIVENFDVFDFELTDAQVTAISALDQGDRTGPDPDEFLS